MSATRQPPGPKGHPLIGSLPEFRRDLLGFLTRCARQYGDVVACRVFHIRCCLVNHPTLIEQVLVREQDRMIKNWDVRQLRVALGDGLLTNEGGAWQRQRRLIQPARGRPSPLQQSWRSPFPRAEYARQAFPETWPRARQ